MFTKSLITITLKVKPIFFICLFIISCSKKTEDIIPEKKCVVSKINLPTWGRVIEMGYDNQKRITTYKNTFTFNFTTFEYDSKGNMIKLLQYADDFANTQATSIIEVNCKYNDKSILQEISIEEKKSFIPGSINRIPVTMNDKKQVTNLKFSNYSVFFEYDSDGNMVKTNDSIRPNDYRECQYDDKKNPYKDFPWIFRYFYTNYGGFGANNITVTKEVFGSIITNYSVKYQYNANGFPVNATQSSDNKVFNEFEYKCD